jgi:hypothetical protein
MAQPTLDGDLGTLTAGTPAVVNVPSVAANTVRWYKFTLPTSVRYQDLRALDVWSFNAGTAQDTEVTLWDSVGNRIASDDDDGNSVNSALSFGTGGGGFPTGTTSITANNGRDGDLLAAGDYYISVTYFNVVLGTTNWTITTPGTTALTAFDLSVRLRDITPVDPVGTIDIGTLGASDTKTASGSLASASVRWFKAVLPGASNAGGTFVDIDTEGSALTPTNDTRIALYTPSGAPAGTSLFTTLQDDEDGSGSLSQLSFGLTSPARPAVGTSVAYNGRDGDLRPGLYYIGVAGFGTSPSTTSTISGQNFGFVSTSTNTGTVRVNLNSQLPSVPASGVGTALSVVEGQSGLLRVTTTAGANPASTATGVVINTTLIGGTSGVVLVDDGSNGDVTAGDGIFSRTITVNVPAQAVQNLPFVVTDSLGRTSNGTLAATVTQSVSGACCATDNSCSITRTFLCTQAGGSFAGAGTDCGGIVNFNQTAGTGTFTSIAAGNTPLFFSATVGGATANYDDGIAEVALPFPVNFYGSPVSTIRVVTNGFIHMNNTGTSTAFTNATIPSVATPNGAVYPMWDDFALQNGTAGNCYVQTDGVAPNRTFTVSWENVGQYSFTTAITPVGSNNFQVVFTEGSDDIQFRYGAMDNQSAPLPTATDTVTVGFENAGGTLAREIAGSAVGSGNVAITGVYGASANPCIILCDDIDFNNDEVFPDDQDVVDFFNVLAGGECPACNDIDFNNNGVFPEDQDVLDFFNVLAGGNCPA